MRRAWKYKQYLQFEANIDPIEASGPTKSEYAIFKGTVTCLEWWSYLWCWSHPPAESPWWGVEESDWVHCEQTSEEWTTPHPQSIWWHWWSAGYCELTVVHTWAGTQAEHKRWANKVHRIVLEVTDCDCVFIYILSYLSIHLPIHVNYDFIICCFLERGVSRIKEQRKKNQYQLLLWKDQQCKKWELPVETSHTVVDRTWTSQVLSHCFVPYHQYFLDLYSLIP